MNKIEKLRDPSHVRCLSASEWRSLMEEHGLIGRMQRHRTKKFDFPQWVKRTSESEQQEQAVENSLLLATDTQKKYLDMKIEKGRVLTHQIEEWMVLCQKTRGDQQDEQRV
jgi:hypothetical protein